MATNHTIFKRHNFHKTLLAMSYRPVAVFFCPHSTRKTAKLTNRFPVEFHPLPTQGYSLGIFVKNHTKFKLEIFTQRHCRRHVKYFPTTDLNIEPENSFNLLLASTSDCMLYSTCSYVLHEVPWLLFSLKMKGKVRGLLFGGFLG
jgi:hypothetical protein